VAQSEPTSSESATPLAQETITSEPVILDPATTTTIGEPIVDQVLASKSKDTLSVDFPDEEIRTILRNVADLFELNLVIPDTLQGRTSLKLREVTWRQIFQVVLSPVGFTFLEDGNIIKIASKDTLATEPFVTNSVVLDNVAAISIEPLLKSILTPGRPATATDSAVQGGTIVLNGLANELIVTDQATVVRQVIEMAKRLDLEPRQVVIETKFIELTKDQTKALGVSIAGKKANIVGGGVSAADGAFNTLGKAYPTGAVTAFDPTASFNAVLDSRDYSVILRALDSYTGTRIVSNPTIVAINGSKSEITIGRDLQLVTATQTAPTGGGTPTVTYTAGEKIFEGVKVEVTPQITSNKLVTLSLKTENSNAEAFTVGAGASAQTFYDVNKRQGSLNMILKDGQTAAIGGLMDEKNTKQNDKVPILGDIPVLGNLFKFKQDGKIDRNLIIFITASILEPSKTTYANLATPGQLNALNLTDRDIQGISYKLDTGETILYQAAKDTRKMKQDAEIAVKLEAERKELEAKKK
jgi:type IV pilus assembly protein PilQ